MKYLNRKFRKDFLQLWPQFISVLVMAALSVAIYCGMSSVWSGMNQSYSEYKEKINLADANLPFNYLNLSLRLYRYDGSRAIF